MVRLSGMQKIADDEGHESDMWTLTCPSAFHAQLADAGENRRYEGHSPRDGQKWLCRMWARARAKFKRLKLIYYGFRYVEPHHDGTPHWHLLVFADVPTLNTISVVLQGIWLSEYADEPGAENAEQMRSASTAARGALLAMQPNTFLKTSTGTARSGSPLILKRASASLMVLTALSRGRQLTVSVNLPKLEGQQLPSGEN